LCRERDHCHNDTTDAHQVGRVGK